MTTESNPSAHASTQSELLRGIRSGLHLMIGFLPFGLVLGAQAIQKGLSIAEITLMTSLSFAGGSDFAAIQLWTWPPQTLLIALMTFLINSRYILMSASITPYIQHLPKRKSLPMLFLLSDAMWALSLTDATKRMEQGIHPGFSVPYYLGSGLTFYFSWVAFTVLGAALGPMLGNLQAYGFDMTIPAVFLVMMKGMWKGWIKAIPWLISLAVAILTYKFIPGAWYVIAGTTAGLMFVYFTTDSK